MRATHSAAESPLIEIPGVVDLYTPTLERRGYRQTAIHAYRGAVEHSWLGPRQRRCRRDRSSLHPAFRR